MTENVKGVNKDLRPLSMYGTNGPLERPNPLELINDADMDIYAKMSLAAKSEKAVSQNGKQNAGYEL